MPSQVTLYWLSLKPRIVVDVSDRPGPFGDGVVAMLGAMPMIELKLPVGGTWSSMKAREITVCGSMAARFACTGATASIESRATMTSTLPSDDPTVPRLT